MGKSIPHKVGDDVNSPQSSASTDDCRWRSPSPVFHWNCSSKLLKPWKRWTSLTRASRETHLRGPTRDMQRTQPQAPSNLPDVFLQAFIRSILPERAGHSGYVQVVETKTRTLVARGESCLTSSFDNEISLGLGSQDRTTESKWHSRDARPQS